MNLPAEIWIVFGETGEYSDHAEWTVAAYTTREAAEDHAAAARKWYDDNGGKELRNEYWKQGFEKNPYDQHMSIDYTGTSWNIFAVTLRDAIPLAPPPPIG